MTSRGSDKSARPAPPEAGQCAQRQRISALPADRAHPYRSRILARVATVHPNFARSAADPNAGSLAVIVAASPRITQQPVGAKDLLQAIIGSRIRLSGPDIGVKIAQ